MKKHTHFIYSLIAGLIMLFATEAGAQTSWTFGTVSDTDKANITADATNWYEDAAQTRYNMFTAIDGPLTANNVELEYAKGLKFKAAAGSSNTNGKIRLNYGKSRLELNGKGIVITIPGLKAGNVVTVSCETAKAAEARGLAQTNLNVKSGFTPATGAQTCEGTVVADGDVTLTTEVGGVNVYSISVSATQGGGDEPGSDPTTYHSVPMNVNMNQALLTATGNDVKYYNTKELNDITIDDVAGTITVRPASGEWEDVFTKNVSNISFAKAIDQGTSGDIENNGIEITEAKGWHEALFVEWKPFTGADSYNVYVKGGQYPDFTKIDDQLVRGYGSYLRADALGLKAGDNYIVKVAPVVGGNEDATKASTASGLKVINFNRDGYAHSNITSGVGAYNNDGTLKANARVIYVTAGNAKTIKMDMDAGGKTETRTGIQDILQAYEKGTETRPLAVRIIGLLKIGDMPTLGSSAEGLQIKGKSQEMNLTIEGVGRDATIHGFGMLIRNSKSVEIRNLAIMRCLDDGLSFDTNNHNVWAHNLDIFYGANKGGDQKKGDGSLDIKGTMHATISNNHFWDTGKTHLNSNGDEVDFVTYRHNWYDHSDSRHPRVRKSQHIHVYNNYFDGVSKYGSGATMGSSLFVEANNYRNCKYPVLMSLQGSDLYGGSNTLGSKGTFSGEEGGVIKVYNNIMQGTYTFIPYGATKYIQKGKEVAAVMDTKQHFDAYMATSRDEKVPSSVSALGGGATYSNFDTASDMYQYTVDDPANVPAQVQGFFGAGRMQHGDVTFTFNNSTEDTNYDINAQLDALIDNYKSSLVKVYGNLGEVTGGGTTGGGTGGGTGSEDPDPTPSETVIAGATVTFNGFTSGSNINGFTITGNLKSGISPKTYNGVTYTTALKMESATNISFTTTEELTITVITDGTSGKRIKFDGTNYTVDANGIVSQKLAAGSHTITKGDSINVYAIIAE
ncbi:pectate lyase [Prevotella sp. PCHR]|uniref:Pectate lyase n=1 Tax=Xylanibacter caecicola TaxID=2736294 RepID=A0ABX2B382_9BACT|nr:pectate lyase [Xylanibacter caecicola]NPE25165.1 pectate lyase [Xylanibacter caecicola]